MARIGRSQPISAVIVHGALTAASVDGASDMVGAGTMTADAVVLHNAAVDLVGAGTATALAAVTHPAAADLAGVGTVTAAATVAHTGATDMAGAGTMTADAVVVHTGAVDMAGAGTMSAASAVTHTGAVDLTGVGTMTADAASLGLQLGAVDFVGAGTMGADGAVLRVQLASVDFVGAGAMSALGGLDAVASVEFEGVGTFGVDGISVPATWTFATPSRNRVPLGERDRVPGSEQGFWGRYSNPVGVCLVQHIDGTWAEYSVLPPIYDGTADRLKEAFQRDPSYTGALRVYRGGRNYVVGRTLEAELEAAVTTEEPGGYGAYTNVSDSSDQPIGDELILSSGAPKVV